MKRKVIVRRARNGLGVFARKHIPEDCVVGRIKGAIVKGEDASHGYSIELGESVVLDPIPPFRSLNHSCEPNCEIFDYEEDGRGKSDLRPVYVGTLRPIECGDELTIDYAWPAETAIPCNCGAPNCRGWIVAEEERYLMPDSAS